MKVLLTGFDPFGGESINPALEAVKLVKDEILGVKIEKVVIPTVFGKSLAVLEKAIKDHKPTIVLCVGQAGGRFGITPERVAINIDDARIKDNEGNQPVGEIFAGAPAAYFTTLPIKSMVKAIKDIDLPSSVSNTAGTFVCNHLMYGALHYANAYNVENGFSVDDEKFLRAGFVHVPYIPKQVIEKVNMPSMSLEDISRALNVAIEAIIKNKEDKNFAAGEIC